MAKVLTVKGARIVSETLFFLLFLLLWRNGFLQRWILVFGLSLLLSVALGRFYCGWICPIETLFRPIDAIYKKMKIKRILTPSFLQKEWLRWVILLVFVAMMMVVRSQGLKINLLFFITLVAVFITLFFQEELWHRYLCPYGALLSLFSRAAPLGLKVDKETCNGCSLCQRSCPSKAIFNLEDRKRSIVKNECLTCFKCEEVCPVRAIGFRYLKKE